MKSLSELLFDCTKASIRVLDAYSDDRIYESTFTDCAKMYNDVRRAMEVFIKHVERVVP